MQIASVASNVTSICPTKATLESSALLVDDALQAACSKNPHHEKIGAAVQVAHDIKDDLTKSAAGTAKMLDTLTKACAHGKLAIGTEFALKKLHECAATPAMAKVIATDVLARLGKKHIVLATCLAAALRGHAA